MRFGFCKCQADPVLYSELHIAQDKVCSRIPGSEAPGPVSTATHTGSESDSSVGVNVPLECICPAHGSSDTKHIPAFGCGNPGQ